MYVDTIGVPELGNLNCFAGGSSTSSPQLVSPQLFYGLFGPMREGWQALAPRQFLASQGVGLVVVCGTVPRGIGQLVLMGLERECVPPVACVCVEVGFSPDRLLPLELVEVLDFVGRQLAIHDALGTGLASPVVAGTGVAPVLLQMVELVARVCRLGRLVLVMDQSGGAASDELAAALVTCVLVDRFNLTISGAFDHLHTTAPWLGAALLPLLLSALLPQVGGALVPPYFALEQVRAGLRTFYEDNLASKMFGRERGAGKRTNLAGGESSKRTRL